MQPQAALSTTTVDLSRTYLEWGEANMAVNKLSGPQHQFIQADVIAWLTEAREAGKEFDLIVLDPPTFSNSKRAKTVLDITRDHGQLIRDTLAILAPTVVHSYSRPIHAVSDSMKP